MTTAGPVAMRWITGPLRRLGVVALVIAGVPLTVTAWLIWVLGVLTCAGAVWVVTGREIDAERLIFGWLDRLLDHTIDGSR